MSRSPAGLERRLQAYLLDRLLAVAAVLGVWWAALGQPLPGDARASVSLALAAALAAEVLLALPLGLTGVTPGGALRGLRVVAAHTGRPLGPVAALARAGVLAAAVLPTAGLGAAVLAFSTVTDPGRRRRGWHDRWTGAVVVAAARPAPEPPAVRPDPPPPALVNLTTQRLADATAPAPPD